jgi:hypothetical protein
MKKTITTGTNIATTLEIVHVKHKVDAQRFEIHYTLNRRTMNPPGPVDQVPGTAYVKPTGPMNEYFALLHNAAPAQQAYADILIIVAEQHAHQAGTFVEHRDEAAKYWEGEPISATDQAQIWGIGEKVLAGALRQDRNGRKRRCLVDHTPSGELNFENDYLWTDGPDTPSTGIGSRIKNLFK